jgi:hypothetical protein
MSDRPEPAATEPWSLPFPLTILLPLLFLGGTLLAARYAAQWFGSAAWFVGALFLLIPLATALTDVVQGNIRPNLRHLAIGYALYAVRIYFLITVQFLSIPLLFLVGPVWLFASVMTVVEIVLWFMPAVGPGLMAYACTEAGIGTAYCAPAIVVYHGLTATLAVALSRYGDRWLDAVVAWLRALEELLLAQLKSGA